MCKKPSVASCPGPIWKELKQANQPFLKIVQSNTATASKKRKASETLGEHAAIAANAKRHKKKFSTIKKNHIIFHGSGVPDLIYYATQQNVEMKEAKGGKGQLGERWDYLKKKRVKQCTMTYNKTIAKLLIKSNYKGRHPTVGCSAHKNAPIGGCKNCKLAEKKHRRTVGKRMTLAIANGKKFQKVVVRGDYTKTCMKAPKVENAYNGKGAPIPVW